MTITTPAHHHPNSDDFADFPLRGPPRSSVIQLASQGARRRVAAVRSWRAGGPDRASLRPRRSQGGQLVSLHPVRQRIGVRHLRAARRNAAWRQGRRGRRQAGRSALGDKLQRQARVPPAQRLLGEGVEDRLHDRRRQGRLLPHPFVRPFADFRLARSLPALLGQASWGDEAHPRAVGQQVEDGDA